MSQTRSVQKEYQVMRTGHGKPSSQHSKDGKFGNADLIINDVEFETEFAGKQQQSPEGGARALGSPRPFALKSNSPKQKTPYLTHNRSQGSIDTLPLSKGSPALAAPHIIGNKHMNQTARDGKSQFGFLKGQERAEKTDSRQSNHQKNNPDAPQTLLLVSMESAKFKERAYKRKKLSQNMVGSNRSSTKGSFRGNMVVGIRNAASRDHTTPTRSQRRTVTLTLQSGGQTEDHKTNTNSVYTENQDELIIAYIDNDLETKLNNGQMNFENVIISDSLEKRKKKVGDQKLSIVSLLNLPDSAESLNQSSLMDSHFMSAEPRLSPAKGRLTSVNNETTKALFDTLTSKQESDEEANEEQTSRMVKLRTILRKAINMSKTSADKTWNQMTPFERAKIKANFEVLLRDVNMAEKQGMAKEVTERRDKSDLIQDLNSCLRSKPIQQTKRPCPNNPIVSHISTVCNRDVVHMQMGTNNGSKTEKIVVIRNELDPSRRTPIAIKNGTALMSGASNIEQEIQLGSDSNGKEINGGPQAMKVVSLVTNATNQLTIPSSPNEHIRKQLTKSQATETELDVVQSQNKQSLPEIQTVADPTAELLRLEENTGSKDRQTIMRQSRQTTNQSEKGGVAEAPLNITIENGRWPQNQTNENKIEYADKIFSQTFIVPEQQLPSPISAPTPIQGSSIDDPGFATAGMMPSALKNLPPTASPPVSGVGPASEMQNQVAAAMAQSQISREMFARIIETAKKQSNKSTEEPGKIVESTLQAISLSKQYNLVGSSGKDQPKDKSDKKRGTGTKNKSDLSHLYTKKQEETELTNPLQIGQLKPTLVDPIKLLNTAETDSAGSHYGNQNQDSPSVMMDMQPKGTLKVQDSRNGELVNSDEGSVDDETRPDYELKKRDIAKSTTLKELAKAGDLRAYKAKLQDQAPATMASHPTSPEVSLVQIQSAQIGSSDLTTTNGQMVAKLSIGDSDPALKKKKNKQKKLMNRTNYVNPEKPGNGMKNNRLKPQKHNSPQQVTGWELQPSPSSFVNRDSSVDMLTINQLSKNPSFQDHASSSKAKLQLLEKRMAEHNAPTASQFKAQAKNQQMTTPLLGKTHIPKVLQTTQQRRTDHKNGQHQAFDSVSQAMNDVTGSQLRGGIVGVKKDLNKAEMKHSPGRQGEVSRLTAKFVETEIDESIRAYGQPMNSAEQQKIHLGGNLTTKSSEADFDKQIKFVEVEQRIVDASNMFPDDYGMGEDRLPKHQNLSVGTLIPTFAKKTSSKGELKVSPSSKNEMNVTKINGLAPSFGFKSKQSFNKAMTESVYSSAKSPFKVQACQANAKTPSNISESDLHTSSQKQNETAQAKKRTAIQNIVASRLAKLNLTATEGFPQTQPLINVQNKQQIEHDTSEEQLTQMTGNDENQMAAKLNEQARPNAIEMVMVDQKYTLNEESQMSRRRPTEMVTIQSRRKQLKKSNVGQRSQSLAPPTVHNCPKTTKIQDDIAVATLRGFSAISPLGSNEGGPLSSRISPVPTQSQEKPQIFTEDDLPKQSIQAAKKLDLRTPIHKLLTSEQMEELQTLLGSKTYRRKQARLKAYLMGPPQADRITENAETSFNAKTARPLKPMRASLPHSQPQQQKKSTVLPNLKKHPAFNIVNAVAGNDDITRQDVYSKQKTTEHVNRVNKLSAAKQTNLILLDPLAGHINIKHQQTSTNQQMPFSPNQTGKLKVATKDKEIVFSKNTTVRKISLQIALHDQTLKQPMQNKTARNSPFLSSGPFSMASPRASTMTQTMTQGMQTQTSKMPQVSQRYKSRERQTTETFIFNDVNKLDSDLKKNSALVERLFQSST